MFGGRLKTWMENHIGRPRKKPPEKEKAPQGGGRAPILESSESLAQSDTGISSGSQQVLSSSGTDNREGYCTTTMESERSGLGHRHTAVSLPSPESAYSTGYSTDGASPGATGPPEYYINIRTGKHYFPSPAPTPTSPQPNAAFSLHSASQCLNAPFLPGGSFAQPPGQSPPFGASPRGPPSKEKKQNAPSTSVPGHVELFGFSKSPCKKSSPKSQLSSLRLFLKSPRQDKGKDKGKGDAVSEAARKAASPTKPRRWFRQPFQKLGGRRTDACEDGGPKEEARREVFPERGPGYLLGKDVAASPRQRNRIKTNPWLPTEPMSSVNFRGLQASFSPGLPRNRSCTNTPLQNRKASEADALQGRLVQLKLKHEESGERANRAEKAGGRPAGQKPPTEPSDHSEEDLTLNEMMGTYNESYVYEKETDILSDSDPTDCEDYGTDSEADNGGDERDSHDDELDFIDNGSATEGEDLPGNTGRCSYHEVRPKRTSFLCPGDRHHSRKDSDQRKSFRRDPDSKARRDRRRSCRKSFRGGGGDDDPLRRRPEARPPHRPEPDENVGGLNLTRVLVQRMMARNGSRSADGSPVSPGSPKARKELREPRPGGDRLRKTRPDSRRTDHADLFLADAEADKKYKELILEAENIFESLQNSPVVRNRKRTQPLQEERRPRDPEPRPQSVDVWKTAEALCRPQVAPGEPEPRKSPGDLGLRLSGETPKKLKRLEFGAERKSSFKAKSSAHSPQDPLGPTFRNFSVFKPVAAAGQKGFGSSSEDSEPEEAFQRKPQPSGGAPGSPLVPIAFQSLDLGKPLTSYCPQSEPVKRKIYSCSKTYDKIAKQFESKPPAFEGGAARTRNGSLGARGPKSAGHRGPGGWERGNQGPPAKGRRREGERLPREGPPFGPKRASLPGDRLGLPAELFG